jgi:hypothetical protein
MQVQGNIADLGPPAIAHQLKIFSKHPCTYTMFTGYSDAIHYLRSHQLQSGQASLQFR